MRHSVSEKQKKKGGRFTALVRLETGRLAVQGQSWLHETLSEKQSKNKARQTDQLWFSRCQLPVRHWFQSLLHKLIFLIFTKDKS